MVHWVANGRYIGLFIVIISGEHTGLFSVTVNGLHIGLLIIIAKEIKRKRLRARERTDS